MHFRHTFARRLAPVVAASLLGCSLYLPAAHAAMVGNNQFIASQMAQQQRSELLALLDRQDLADQLTALGAQRDELQARVAALSDAEVAELRGQLEQLPAGSGVLEVALLVFLVLLATDILGYTDVFPFVKHTVKK